MKGIKRHVPGIVRGLFFIGLSIQILLGIFWMAANFTGFQEFGDSYHYISISESFLSDEYTGILYPLIIRIVREIGRILPLPWYCLLYLLQFLLAGYSGYQFLKRCGLFQDNRESLFFRIWATAAVITVPALMQCHLALLPDSFVLSLLLLMLSEPLFAAAAGTKAEINAGTGAGTKVGATADRREIHWAKIMVCYILAALLVPDYLCLAGLPILVMVCCYTIRQWQQNKKKSGRTVLLFLVSVCLIITVNHLTQVEGSYGRVRKSFAITLVSRFAWPNFAVNYSAWPQEIHEIISYEEAEDASRFADGADILFGRKVEAAVGIKEAERLYYQMAKAALDVRTKDIVYKITLDAVSYTVSPFMLARQLAGGGYDSYSGRNYEIMKDHTPGLTKYYVYYGSRWFAAGSILALLTLIYRKFMEKAQNTGIVKIKGKRYILIAAVGIILFYTMSGGGIMDYKNSIFVTLLWYIWMLRT